MLDPVTEPEVVEEGESLRGFPVENRFADSPRAEKVVEEALVEEELLVEDVSIDGMCGVY